MNINVVAEDCNCSKSSIVKFCKELGLEGFKELIRILMWEYSIFKVIDNKIDSNNLNIKYFSQIEENINNLKNNNFNTFLKVSELIKKM
ncbi:hypothetical protein SLITO_v1c05610 [Spiroplasma litorale]|uniref:HTH rpiR-type domain-containing protein n=2 Tax=Spiroplasma litorale TaxID=216942 RepID=A0A0K1W1J9_9MOLU|nr:hypothetical protein SLITO_v1c05610 [Spiroplasma litorale]